MQSSPAVKAAAASIVARRRQKITSDNNRYQELTPASTWIQSQFFIPELQGPIILYPHQIAALTEALSVDADGLFKYDLVLWSDIAKSAKSTIAGAVVLWRAIHTERGKFRIVANDLKQAASRVFEAITTCLELNRELGKQFTTTKYQVTHVPTGSVIEAVPVDPKGEAGGGDDMVEFTELHSADNDAAKKMWTETKLSPLKHGKSQRWIDTYAGFSGESPILEPMYQALVQDGNRISAEYQFYAQGRSFAMWNTTPRLPWQTSAYYSSEAQQLLPNEYRRIHHNEWVSSTSSFIQIEWFDACRVDVLPPINKFKEIFISLDAAVSGDCFAMTAVSRDNGKSVLRYARAWTPVNGIIHYRDPLAKPGPDYSRDYPEGELRWLCQTYRVIIVTYDPFQLHSFCTGLAVEGLAAFEEFSQERPRLIADKALHDHIMNGSIVHDGSYPDLREHLNNANSTAEDKNTLRIVKRTLTKKIDLAVALSMCDDRARWYVPDE